MTNSLIGKLNQTNAVRSGMVRVPLFFFTLCHVFLFSYFNKCATPLIKITSSSNNRRLCIWFLVCVWRPFNLRFARYQTFCCFFFLNFIFVGWSRAFHPFFLLWLEPSQKLRLHVGHRFCLFSVAIVVRVKCTVFIGTIANERMFSLNIKRENWHQLSASSSINQYKRLCACSPVPMMSHI